MTDDLISRKALLDAIASGTGEVGDIMVQIEHAEAIVPTVVANISGGLLQGASADYPINVYTLDFDDIGEEHEQVVVDGDEAYPGAEDADVNPEWVATVAETIQKKWSEADA